MPIVIAAVLPLYAAVVSGSVSVAPGASARGRSPATSEGIVVWLEADDRRAPAIEPRVVRMLQKRKQFVPHLLAIPVGTTVEFPNLDPIFHNAFSNIDGQPFDVGLYPPGASRQVLFRRPGVVRIFCNIHQSMSAVIVVAPTPWIAVSDKSGVYSLGDVEPGRYTLHFYYERATQQTLDSLSRKIEVLSSAIALPRVQVSESGYIEMPHMNKYGQEYGPVPEDGTSYRKAK